MLLVLMMSALLVFPAPSVLTFAVGDDEPTRIIDLKLQERARLAAERGLEYLKQTQNADGSWTDKIGRKVHYEYRGRLGKHVGVTSLACLAFLAQGSLPGRGKYGEQVEKGLDFILRTVQTNGFISTDESRMYSHAFATLFLAEVYGMTGMEKVKERLKSAAGLIVQAQNDTGGWRYQPGADDADMSITVCQVIRHCLMPANSLLAKTRKTSLLETVSQSQKLRKIKNLSGQSLRQLSFNVFGKNTKNIYSVMLLM
jgi:squalene cyclase